LAEAQTTYDSGQPETMSSDATPTLVELILTIFKSLTALVVGKIRLAQLEFSQDFGTLLSVAILGLCAGVAIVLALALAGAGLAYLITAWTGSLGGSFLLVGLVYLLAGAILLLAARSRVRKMGGFLSESRADLKRDDEWLKSLS